MTIINSGIYRIRNASTNQYLAPKDGFASSGQPVVFEETTQDGAQKWSLTYHAELKGTYQISNFVNADMYLSRALTNSFREVPALVVNTYPYPWCIYEPPTNPGHYILQNGEDKSQVAEADAGTGSPVLNDYVRTGSEIRQMWIFEVA